MEAYPRSNLGIAALVAVTLSIFVAALPAREDPQMARVPVSLSIVPDVVPQEPVAEVQTVEPPVEDTGAQASPTRWQHFEIRRGDNLSSIFKDAGLSARELHSIMGLGADVNQLKKIIPGKNLYLEVDLETSSLVTLRYEESPLRKLVVARAGDSYAVQKEIIEPEVLISFATATITDAAPSLYHAGKRAGLSDGIIMKLSYLFQWDISFALDLRQGDSFALMYEDKYVEGQKIGEGNIVAAQFNNMGKAYTAVLYEDEAGNRNYFTPEGRSLRKAFLRDPVHFSHVSSSFNLKRLHPIHKKVMPHRGIDYAAKRGTPVLASGDGKVTIARQNNASGRYVVIQHGEQYTTKYLHLNGFAKGVRAGKSVKQGEVIGYVGATGWATAPHLHYEFLVNGVHRNPRTVALPQANPVPKEDFAKFTQSTMTLLTELSSIAGETSFAFVPPKLENTGGL